MGRRGFTTLKISANTDTFNRQNGEPGKPRYTSHPWNKQTKLPEFRKIDGEDLLVLDYNHYEQKNKDWFREKDTNHSSVLQENLCHKLFFLQNIGRTCCVQKFFWMSKTIFVHNMFSPCLQNEELLAKIYLYTYVFNY